MQTKTLLIIIAVLVVLVLVWVGISSFGSSSSQGTVDIGLSKLTEDAVSRMVIHNTDEQLELVRTDGEWMIGEQAVDPTHMHSIWDAFDELEITGPVSKNAANHDRFDVSESSGTYVSFYGGDHELLNMVIGNSPSFNSSYIRLDAHDEVYSADTNLVTLFSLDVNDWLDKTVVNVTRDQITRVVIDTENELVLSEFNGTWSQEGGSDSTAEVPKNIMDALFANVGPLKADSLLESDRYDSFANKTPRQSIRFYSVEGETVAQVDLFAQEDDNWIVSNGDHTTFFVVPGYRLEDVFLNKDDLFGEAL